MAFFTSPYLIDLIVVVTLLEATILLALRSLSPLAIVRMLLPGIFLLLALRAALAEAAWPWVPLALSAALIAHLFDLQGRWRR